MKILFNCQFPFMLAHGGTQIQIEETTKALRGIGIEVEPVRWWDDSQTGDVLQHFGRIPTHLLRAAHAKGMKVVLSDQLTEAGSRSRRALWLQWIMQRLLTHLLPTRLLRPFNWESYLLADACLTLTRWEARLIQQLFNAPASRVHVIPNGVEDIFLTSKATTRGKWLVCTAAITPRKRVVELAEAAVLARTPLWVIGKAYSESDPYAIRFMEITQRNPELIRYEGPVADRGTLAEIYREARGFVLLSTIESLSLSALEGTACGCPLLLSDLPWARTVFEENALYCPIASAGRTATALKNFYETAPNRIQHFKPLSWTAVAEKLKSVYLSILR